MSEEGSRREEEALREAQRREDEQRRDLLEERRHLIGGSDVPAILGLSSFGRTGLDVWMRLVGMGELGNPDMQDRFELGLLLEEPIAQRYTRKTGVTLRKPGGLLVHPKYPWAGGHIDRESVDGARDVECKTVDAWGVAEWSDPSKGEPVRVPEDYALQVMWYLWLRLWERRHDIAAQIGFQPLRVYPFLPDDQTLRQVTAAVVERVHEWYERYVVTKEPPPLGAGEGAKRWLKSRFPRPDTEMVAAYPEAEEIRRLAMEAEEKAAEWTAKEEAFKNQLRAMIGDHYGIAGEGWKITWPRIPEQTKAVTDWPAIVKELELTIPEEVWLRHTRTVVVREAYRRLSPLSRKGK